MPSSVTFLINNQTQANSKASQGQAVKKQELDMKGVVPVAKQIFPLCDHAKPNTQKPPSFKDRYFNSFDNPIKMSLCSFLSLNDLEALKLTSRANNDGIKKMEPQLAETTHNIQLLAGISPSINGSDLLFTKVVTEIHGSLLLFCDFYIKLFECVCECMQLYKGSIEKFQTDQKQEYDTAFASALHFLPKGQAEFKLPASVSPTFQNPQQRNYCASFSAALDLFSKKQAQSKSWASLESDEPYFLNQDLEFLQTGVTVIKEIQDARGMVFQRTKLCKNFLDRLLKDQETFKGILKNLGAIRQDIVQQGNVLDATRKYMQLQKIYTRLEDTISRVVVKLDSTLKQEDYGHDNQLFKCSPLQSPSVNELKKTFTQQWRNLSNLHQYAKREHSCPDIETQLSTPLFLEMLGKKQQLEKQGQNKGLESDPVSYAMYWFRGEYGGNFFSSKLSEDTFSACVVNTVQAINLHREDRLRLSIRAIKYWREKIKKQLQEPEKTKIIQNMRLLYRCFSSEDIQRLGGLSDGITEYENCDMPDLVVRLMKKNVRVYEMSTVLNDVIRNMPHKIKDGDLIDKSLGGGFFRAISLFRSQLNGAMRQEFDQVICVDWICERLWLWASDLVQEGFEEWRNQISYWHSLSDEEQIGRWKVIGRVFLYYRNKFSDVERTAFDALAVQWRIITPGGERSNAYSDDKKFMYSGKYRGMSFQDAMNMAESKSYGCIIS